MWRRLFWWWNRKRERADLEEELRAHIAIEARQQIDQGSSPDDAHLLARRSFGNVTRIAEGVREVWAIRWLRDLQQDLHYGARMLRRNPGFTSIAVLSLGLGIGANTAILSAVDEALLRPLAVPQPGRLVNVFNISTKEGRYVSSSLPDMEDYRARGRTLASISGYVRFPANATLVGRTERIQIEAATGEYFSTTLSLTPLIGRNYGNEDDSRSAPPVAMLHETYWESAFRRNPHVIGATIQLEDQTFTIVGIVPERYRGSNLNWQDTPQVWIPLRAAPRIVPAFTRILNQRVPWLVLIGRLRDGFTTQQAQAEIQTIAASIAAAEPRTNANLSARVFSAASSKFWPAYREEVTRSFSVFAAAAVLVLLLTCMNIANLLLERAEARRRELMIRIQLGTSRSRLVRQLFTEGAMLAVPGFVLSLAVARAAQSLLLSVPNAFGLPLNLSLSIDTRTLMLCVLLTSFSILVFAVLPAWRGAHLQDPSAGRGSHLWMRRILVGSQIVLSTILLIGGGLFFRSLMNGYTADVGFRPDHLLTVTFPVPQEPAVRARLRQAQADLSEHLRVRPEIEAVSLAGDNLLGGAHSVLQLSAKDSGSSFQAVGSQIGVDFFSAAGVPILNGRAFTASDALVPVVRAIVNQSTAARLWPDQNPIGRQLQMGKTTVEIVGVARDAKYRSLWEPQQPCIYVLLPNTSPANFLLLRTRSASDSLIPLIQREWNTLGLQQPLTGFRTGSELLKLSLEPERIATGLLGLSGLLAIVLAVIGIYGVISYGTRQHEQEYAIRLAIGARPFDLLRTILANSLHLSLAGVVVGVVISLGLMRFIASRLHGVQADDIATFVSVALGLILVSLVAALRPACRAAYADPVKALRRE